MAAYQRQGRSDRPARRLTYLTAATLQHALVSSTGVAPRSAATDVTASVEMLGYSSDKPVADASDRTFGRLRGDEPKPGDERTWRHVAEVHPSSAACGA
jgi:hypothetical protein